MKVTRRQLKFIIETILLEDTEDVNLVGNLDKEREITFTLKSKGDKVDAEISDEKTNVFKKLTDSPEDKKTLLGALKKLLDDATSEQGKDEVLKAFRLLFADSEETPVSKEALAAQVARTDDLKVYAKNVTNAIERNPESLTT